MNYIPLNSNEISHNRSNNKNKNRKEPTFKFIQCPRSNKYFTEKVVEGTQY